jgi:hypothetical protein
MTSMLLSSWWWLFTSRLVEFMTSKLGKQQWRLQSACRGLAGYQANSSAVASHIHPYMLDRNRSAVLCGRFPGRKVPRHKGWSSLSSLRRFLPRDTGWHATGPRKLHMPVSV